MMEVSPFQEVLQFRMSREVGGKPLYWVAAYLVDGLLIDTGCRYTSDEFVSSLDGKDIRLAVNTHHHEDHVGANLKVQEKFKVKIFAHPLAVPLISRNPALKPYQEFVWGYPEPSVTNPLPGVVQTENYTFQVVETPGHCRDHIALLEPDRGWCFSGDIFVSENQKVLRADEDINQISRSVEKLLKVAPERLVLFTSIGSIVEDGRKALLKFLDYLRETSIEVRRLDKEGFSPPAIRDRVFGRESSKADRTGGHYSSENLVRSILYNGPAGEGQ